MEIEFATRAEMVGALVALTADGHDVAVVGLGRTLRVPDDVYTEFAEPAEDLIGGTSTEQAPNADAQRLEQIQGFVHDSSEAELRAAVESGLVTKAEVATAEAAGKARKGVLAFAAEDD